MSKLIWIIALALLVAASGPALAQTACQQRCIGNCSGKGKYVPQQMRDALCHLWHRQARLTEALGREADLSQTSTSRPPCIALGMTGCAGRTGCSRRRVR